MCECACDDMANMYLAYHLNMELKVSTAQGRHHQIFARLHLELFAQCGSNFLGIAPTHTLFQIIEQLCPCIIPVVNGVVHLPLQGTFFFTTNIPFPECAQSNTQCPNQMKQRFALGAR